MKKKIMKILLGFFITFCVLVIFICGILALFGKIQDYKYLKITEKNKDVVINLLKEQEKNMFNINSSIELNECYDNLNKIEVIYRFPDGEDYTLYCKKNKFYFSLDNSNYDLPRYLGENGKLWIKINW